MHTAATAEAVPSSPCLQPSFITTSVCIQLVPHAPPSPAGKATGACRPSPSRLVAPSWPACARTTATPCELLAQSALGVSVQSWPRVRHTQHADELSYGCARMHAKCEPSPLWPMHHTMLGTTQVHMGLGAQAVPAGAAHAGGRAAHHVWSGVEHLRARQVRPVPSEWGGLGVPLGQPACQGCRRGCKQRRKEAWAQQVRKPLAQGAGSVFIPALEGPWLAGPPPPAGSSPTPVSTSACPSRRRIITYGQNYLKFFDLQRPPPKQSGVWSAKQDAGV